MDQEFLKKFSKKLDESLEKARSARMEDERRRIMSTIGQDLAKMLQPFLKDMASSAKSNKEEMRDAMYEALGVLNAREIQIDTAPIIGAIEAAFMGLQLPEPKVTVNVPEIKMPDMKLPDIMPIEGFVKLMANRGEVSYNNPLPVIMYDKDGKPVNLLAAMTQVLGGGGGGFRRVKIDNTSSEPIPISGTISATFSADFGEAEVGSQTLRTVQATNAISSVAVKEIFGSTVTSSVLNGDNRIRVSVETGGSGLTDSELRATAVPVSQASGANWSVSVSDVFGTIGTNVVNPDGRVKVELPTGSSGLTDTELRASSVPVAQASGAVWSTAVTDVFATTQTSVVVNTDNRVRVELPSYTQPISVTDIFATSSTSNVVNPDNRVKVELPATSVTVTSITNSTAAAIVDSGGVQYSGSNPLPITVVNGAASTTNAVLTRQSNPTAVAADYVPLSADDLGRQLVRPVQVRDLIVTAYVSVTNGTETTLLAASAGNFHDLIYLLAANNSDAAVSVDIRSVTGGNVITTLRIPANGSVGFSLPVPIPQDATGNNWTIDGPDETGRTITVSALFSREV